MNQEDLTYQNTDDAVRKASGEIPVTYNPENWEDLASKLDKAKVSKTPSFNPFKFIYLNVLLVFIGFTAVLFAFLIPDDQTSAPEKPAITVMRKQKVRIGPKHVNPIRESTFLSVKNSLETTIQTTEVIADKSNLSAGLDTLLIDSDPGLLEKSDSDSNKLFIFW